MPRKRAYENGAARQAAYRARHQAQAAPRQGYLAALARTLHGELLAAVGAGRSPVPAALITARADETLRNLIRDLRQARETEDEAAETRSPGAEEKGGERH
jgi:hypothetical protein